MHNTSEEFDSATAECRAVFSNKLSDYGPAWRIMRPQSVTDQIYIKAKRIRTLETKGNAMVDEGIRPELIGIINYAVIGLIQLQLGYVETCDISKKKALELYDSYMAKSKALMMAKNHDYDEVWRMMRPESYTDLILMKINRTKEIEDHQGKTVASEGIDANYYDMINYAVFGLIKMNEKE